MIERNVSEVFSDVDSTLIVPDQSLPSVEVQAASQKATC
jgi:hypothetical protein